MGVRDLTLVNPAEAVRNLRNSDARFSFVSLYSGAGGLDVGFVRAGFYPIWANDVDRDAVDSYNTYFGGSFGHAAICGDISHQALPAKGSAALVVGGPPCQGFSVAGRMDPSDPRSRHVWEFFRVVRHVEPVAFVMENVVGLASNRRWVQLRGALIREARHGLGYSTQLFTLRASHFGVAQNRERMFLVGIRNAQPREPRPVSAANPPSVRSVLQRLPRYGTAGNDTLCAARVTPAKRPVLRRSPFAGMLFNGQGRPLNLDAPAPTLPASMGGNHTPIVDQVHLEGAGDCWVSRYHGHLLSGGDPYSDAPTRLRRLTLEECAAIQTFPRDFHWAGRLNSRYKQVGNAVPPKLAFHVALAVREALGLG